MHTRLRDAFQVVAGRDQNGLETGAVGTSIAFLLLGSFGLGGEDQIRSLEITWPGGRRQVLEDVPIDRILEIREDTELVLSF